MKQFDTVPIKIPAKNVFNLSHDVKATYNFDKIYPFLCHPVYPGDTFNARAEVFMRTMPMFAPVMHNVDMFVYFFFVPNRLLWNANKKADWRTFITGGEQGTFGDHGEASDPSSDYVLPHFTYRQIANGATVSTTAMMQYYKHGSLLDHMGFPSCQVDATHTPLVKNNTPICSLPLRAYQLVWNEYFRNQNLQNEIEFSYDGGAETYSDLIKLLTFRKKCWEKDYFTSCLPWQQRGEAIQLPITNTMAVTGVMTGTASIDTAKLSGSDVAHGLVVPANDNGYIVGQGISSSSSDRVVTLEGTSTVTSGTLQFSGSGIGTIADFRYCMRLQQWLENNARCGSRYIEQILSHFGVVSSDARLQRPELLGGGKIPLLFQDVPQTSATTEDSVQGNLAGKGMLFGKTAGFKKYFEEHGVLLGVCTIIPRTSYSQGIPRYWTAFDKTDWYFPEFAHLSEQAVLNKEIYFDPSAMASLSETGEDGVFGYQGRFTELRYIPSSVHGDMRGSLQYWHFGRLFDSLPTLNSDFVEADSRVNVFSIEDVADGDEDPFVCQIHLDLKAVRPLPKFAVPSL